MNKKTKNIIYIILMLAIVALGTWRLVKNKKHLDEQNKPHVIKAVNIPVTYVVAHYQTVNDSLVKTGTLLPIREADINAIAGGKLVGVNFKLGSYVSQGQVLAYIDNEALRLNMQQAELERERAAKDVERFTVLVKGNAATQMNLDDAKYRLDNANARISLLKRQNVDNSIKAPISGEVVTKIKEQGEFVAPGVVLGHIVDNSKVKASVMINELDVYSLKKGAKAKITTDVYPGIVYEGVITFISQKADGAHNYQVEVTIDNMGSSKLMAGTFVQVDFSRMSTRNMLLIPRTAFVDGLSVPKVYIAQNGKALLRNIVIGKEIGSNVEVLSGLQEGDKVVVSGLMNIKDSTSIEPRPMTIQ